MVARITITALGCSGPVAAHIVTGFLGIEGVHVRLLARNPELVRDTYPNDNLEVIRGSMANPDAVAKATEGSDLAFLITPMGKNNDPTTEVNVARLAIKGCQQGKLPHLVYASVLNPKAIRDTGVGILDAKFEIEQLIRDSGVPFSILRCGSYMEDVFDPRLSLLQKGFFLFPIDKQQRFNYTAQSDIPRLLVDHLAPKAPLNGYLDFIEPNTYTIVQVEQALSEAAGYRIRTLPQMPFFYIFKFFLPLFRWTGHRFSSVIPLMEYFSRHGYTGNPLSMKNEFEAFSMTSVEEHLSRLFENKKEA
mmetsp:Transcript_4515/g.9091  ORF Transcript_4515/g.9091 Transcript_4515/m.9091 type:complete len:305 (-) Transcript_4515:58-972(-)